MTEEIKSSSKNQDISETNTAEKITVSKNGPYIVTGTVPLITMEICGDDQNYCQTWREVNRYPLKDKYALCRCGGSKNKPFCDGTHAKIHFDGTEAEDYALFDTSAEVIHGPALTLTDKKKLCAHARFCLRVGGIRSLVAKSDDQEARNNAIEEVYNCPAGRLVITDNKSEKVLEPEFERSIVVIEYPPLDEHGPLWVRGSIPIESANGKLYEIRNRVTLCKCGISKNKPFCDGSHIEE
jgi:CDGSH-type Zn-finger protein